MIMEARMQLRMDEAVKRRIEDAAKIHKLDVSEYIRRVMSLAIELSPKALQALQGYYAG